MVLVVNHVQITEERRPFLLSKWNDNYGLWEPVVGFQSCDSTLLHPDHFDAGQHGSMAYMSIFRSNVVKIQLLPLYRYHKMTK